MEKNEFIKFYGEYNISPVKQDISYIDIHYKKREKLFKLLGISPSFFKGKRILEVGPGSGYNTLAFLKWGAQVDLVEPNYKGRNELVSLFEKEHIKRSSWILNTCTIEEFIPTQRYDFIIAEGFVPNINNQEEVIEKLISMLNEGGIIVLTCVDEISTFFEQIKRLIAQIIIKDIESFDEKVNVLSQAFKKHLEALPQATRGIEDWVTDQFINPAINCVNLMGMDKCIEYFTDEFELLGSSPRLFEDYSWYKDIEFDWKTHYLEQFKMKRHNLIMTESPITIFTKEKNDILLNRVQAIRDLCIKYEEDKNDNFIQMIYELKAVRDLFEGIDNKVYLAIADIINILNEKDFSYKGLDKYEDFTLACGRGQQYVSMLRKISY
jgi:ubiquinone/menaquinone biosynthesis C-methylase UbiE